MEKDDHNYSLYAPDLPGCIASGVTVGDTTKRMREAVELHIEGLRLAGAPIPEPTCECG